jgi:hypothetical protein
MKNQDKTTLLEKFGYGLKYTLAITIAILAISALCFIFISITTYFAPPLQPMFDQERLGQLGDFLGGTLNPIFGLVTVLLLIYSLHIQRKELKLTRKELKKSSKALSGQLKLSTNESTRNQLTELVRLWADDTHSILNKDFNGLYLFSCKNIQELSLINQKELLRKIFKDSLIISAPKINLEEIYNQPEAAIMSFRDNALVANKKLREFAGLTQSLIKACNCEQVEIYWQNHFTSISQSYLNAGIIDDTEYNNLNESLSKV